MPANCLAHQANGQSLFPYLGCIDGCSHLSRKSHTTVTNMGNYNTDSQISLGKEGTVMQKTMPTPACSPLRAASTFLSLIPSHLN